MSKAAAVPDRLFGVPGAEWMHDDLGAAYEQQIECHVDEHDRAARVIEEWSVGPPSAHLMAPADLVAWLLEGAADSAGTEGYYDHVDHLERDPVVLAAAQALIDALADRITYRVADKRLAEHVITWDGAGEPLVNGQRLYVPRVVSSGGC